jgi:hypothetical protein
MPLTLEDVPPDALHLVMERLSVYDVANLSRVSKMFNYEANVHLARAGAARLRDFLDRLGTSYGEYIYETDARRVIKGVFKLSIRSLRQINHEVVEKPVSDEYANARRYLVRDVRELALRTYGSKGGFSNDG